MLVDMPDEPTPARRRVAEHLKTLGPATATALADVLDLTPVAVRQHLQALEAAGLVASAPLASEGRGRPSQAWSLTADAAALFPDRHGDLTVGLIDAIRAAVGEDGLERVVRERGEQQKREYREIVPGPDKRLRARLDALARQRTREGYMAEVRREGKGTYLLLEHHCPICVAATACTGLCAVELDVFRDALGADTEVERISHLIDGDPRCVYRIRERGSRSGD